MKNMTGIIEDIYVPVKALVVYESLTESKKGHYVEAYDMDDEGRPFNARPLTEEEVSNLCNKLQIDAWTKGFLRCEGLLPDNVLALNFHPSNGYAVWYTKPQRVRLYFKKSLGIPEGEACVPALLWKADRTRLEIFALAESKKPSLKTCLYHAPFFNVYENGSVCMGTVDVEISEDSSLHEFISTWQASFFDSYFSHTMNNHAPVSKNIIELWKGLVNSKKKFPVAVLKKNQFTLKNILR